MLGYAARRSVVALGLVWVVATLVFLVIHLIPGDPAELLLSESFESRALGGPMRFSTGMLRLTSPVKSRKAATGMIQATATRIRGCRSMKRSGSQSKKL